MDDPMTPASPPAPSDERIITPEARMDAVTLRVGDLDGMSSYYENALALRPLDERVRGTEVHRVLGRDGTPMVRLVHAPGLPPFDPRQAGLYHTAFLFEDAASLAATVYRTAREARSRFQGSSDHLVSEAFYFADPEGNGIELYVDRDRRSWRDATGRIRMDTLYLDPNAYLQRHLTQEALDAAPTAAATVGHVHLQVGDIEAARPFYVDALGFEVTIAEYPGALFTSAGGYHHHLGINSWQSRGAGPRAASLGLGEVAVTVPGREDLDALIGRLRFRGIPFEDTGRSVTATDPWGTRVSVGLPNPTAPDLLG